MTVWEAVLLGLVQGIAEILPISSSGHLSVLNNLFGMTTTENGHVFFDVLLHLGTLISALLTKTGMTFPVYIGAMIVAAVIRNIGESTGKIKVYMGEINDLGGICLSLFLGIAMITLKIWQLAALALPLVILLLVQLAFMYLFARFVIFRFMGRDYDAMANMQAICDKYVPSIKAYLLIPIVGSLFADFINSLVITFFINLV